MVFDLIRRDVQRIKRAVGQPFPLRTMTGFTEEQAWEVRRILRQVPTVRLEEVYRYLTAGITPEAEAIDPVAKLLNTGLAIVEQDRSRLISALEEMLGERGALRR